MNNKSENLFRAAGAVALVLAVLNISIISGSVWSILEHVFGFFSYILIGLFALRGGKHLLVGLAVMLAGKAAAFAKELDTWRFFEWDPPVLSISIFELGVAFAAVVAVVLLMVTVSGKKKSGLMLWLPVTAYALTVVIAVCERIVGYGTEFWRAISYSTDIDTVLLTALFVLLPLAVKARKDEDLTHYRGLVNRGVMTEEEFEDRKKRLGL